jgi:hypothetical protein
MVFGFVGFFIMGFAYHAVPGFKHSALWKPRLACWSLPLMAAGILLQTIAHLMSPPSLRVELLAAFAQLVAVAIFGLVVVQTIRQANKPEAYDRFICAGIGWLLVAAVVNPIIFRLFELPLNRQELLFNLATFNIPYRDIQLLGFAVMMLLGLSLRLLPEAYGLREPSRAWVSFLFWGVNGSIFLGVLLFIAGMTTGNHWLLIGQWLTAVVLLVVAAGNASQHKLFGTVPENQREGSLKFIRAAYLWFILAMTMLVFAPLYNFAIYMPLTGSHVPFSHAFFGAYRHALTVGFVMMMIVGVSIRVAGVGVRRTRSLWPAFVLLNVGNLTRVSFQIGTDFSPAAYQIMAVSGFIEMVGLALWAYELVARIRAGRFNHARFESAGRAALPSLSQ